MLLCIIVGGLVAIGNPCQSWVVLSRSFTQRSVMIPQGPTLQTGKQSDYLERHNLIADVTALLIRTARAINIHYMLEQPLSSLLNHYSPIVRATHDAMSTPFEMSAFGGDSPKPLLVRHNCPWMRVAAPTTTQTTNKTKSKNNQPRSSGRCSST